MTKGDIMKKKQLAVPLHTWEALNDRKIHPRETMGDVIDRLLGIPSQTVSKSSSVEENLTYSV